MPTCFIYASLAPIHGVEMMGCGVLRREESTCPSGSLRDVSKRCWISWNKDSIVSSQKIESPPLLEYYMLYASQSHGRTEISWKRVFHSTLEFSSTFGICTRSKKYDSRLVTWYAVIRCACEQLGLTTTFCLLQSLNWWFQLACH